MDFYRIREHRTRSGVIEIYPEFLIVRSRDIMVEARDFVGIWDEEAGLWSTDEYDVARIVDDHIDRYIAENRNRLGENVYPLYMRNFSSKTWMNFKSWITKIPDNAKRLDQTLIYADTPVRKEDYASKRLPYSLEQGEPEAWNTMISKLYAPEEREKIEWSIGSVVSGDSKKLQKFLVLYGEKGTGKSTILDIIQKLFVGYYSVFEAKSLGQANNQFATEAFKKAPLVAIQHDGDLSRIEDNTKLNSIISHEEMVINEKFKPTYNSAMNAFLFMGTNHPVKITDAKSGIIRRLIDATPTGDKFPPHEYEILVNQINTELGRIAQHCLDVYRSLGKNYYRDYIPIEMMFKTDTFYNFVENSYLDLVRDDPITLKRAWEMYKSYVDEARMEYSLPLYKFREAFKDYYHEYAERYRSDGQNLRNVYIGFKKEKFEQAELEATPEIPYSLTLDKTESLLDKILSDCPAQYSSSSGTPSKPWASVTTALKDIDTSKEHYVKLPENHIVIDFDLKDDSGEKSLEKNLEAASKLPATYSEVSKGGQGLHLHYIYDGDTSELANEYSPNVEIKVYRGNASLRRRVSLCNDLEPSHISEGLPLKEHKVINKSFVETEKSLRRAIEKNLRKEVHGATKPSIDFIKKLLDDAYDQGLNYDLSDLQPKVLSFALSSTNQADNALRVFSQMKFVGPKSDIDLVADEDKAFDPDKKLVFYDIEVYPNLFLVCWKVAGEGASVVKMINPTPNEMEAFVNMPLVGFNNRRYDNHLIYARWMGASVEECYKLSSRIISGDRGAMYGPAYNLSYTDIYDFAAKKQSLKKWEVELGIEHIEMDIPWDQPVPDDKLDKVIEYCANDVKATETVFNRLKEDFDARLILADLAGMTPNTTTNTLTQQIIFGNDKNPPFVHSDLSETFPGYTYSFGKSVYRGEEVGEGGYVYAEPGQYRNVALLDVASMHPHSLIELKCFGDEYTKQFKGLVDGRLAVKHNDEKAINNVLNGMLKPYFSEDKSKMKTLSNALKLPINSVYGLTGAKFPNRCNGNDPSNNPDNIVAKRGALFMVDLKHFVQEKGFTVAHIKTDSIKIPEATPEIIEEVMEFGKKYGYTFEHEETYERMCLVNDAVYIAKTSDGRWTATGAQFQHPIVFKTLFSHEEIELEDYFETKTVTTSLYLEYDEGEEEPRREFVGRVGQFAPVISTETLRGGRLVREKDGKFYAATGSKGHLWQLSNRVYSPDQIDKSYSQRLVDEAIENINLYGPFEDFVN